MKEETAEKRQGPNAVRCYLCEYQLPTVMRFTKLQRMVGTQRDGQCEMNAQKLFPERGNKSDTYYRMDGLWGHYAEEKKKKHIQDKYCVVPLRERTYSHRSRKQTGACGFQRNCGKLLANGIEFHLGILMSFRDGQLWSYNNADHLPLSQLLKKWVVLNLFYNG